MPHLKVKENFCVLKAQFRDLQTKADKALSSQQIISDEVRLRLTDLCVDEQNKIPFFDKVMCQLLTKMAITDIMILMRQFKIWDPINYHILAVLLNECVPKEHAVHHHLKEYSLSVQEFKHTTLLSDYMAIVGPNQHCPHGCITITAKFNRKYDEYTMEKFAQDQAFLADEFHLHQSIFRFKESCRGCVIVTWFVPKSTIELLKPANIIKNPELEKRLLEIIVDEKYIIYRVSFLPL